MNGLTKFLSNLFLILKFYLLFLLHGCLHIIFNMYKLTNSKLSYIYSPYSTTQRLYIILWLVPLTIYCFKSLTKFAVVIELIFMLNAYLYLPTHSFFPPTNTASGIAQSFLLKQSIFNEWAQMISSLSVCLKILFCSCFWVQNFRFVVILPQHFKDIYYPTLIPFIDSIKSTDKFFYHGR